jgi:hypothetical protein
MQADHGVSLGSWRPQFRRGKISEVSPSFGLGGHVSTNFYIEGAFKKDNYVNISVVATRP